METSANVKQHQRSLIEEPLQTEPNTCSTRKDPKLQQGCQEIVESRVSKPGSPEERTLGSLCSFLPFVCLCFLSLQTSLDVRFLGTRQEHVYYVIYN